MATAHCRTKTSLIHNLTCYKSGPTTPRIVVGYANKAWTESCDMMVCSQFKAIGDEPMTLAQFVPGGNWMPMGDVVRVFNSDSRVKFQAIYIDENTAAQIKQIPGHDYIKAGWWDKNKKDGIGIPTEDAYVGDEPMPIGCTVMGNAATAGAYLTTNGEVIQSETGKIRFVWESSCDMMVGNCTPVDLTLKNFVPGGNWMPMGDVVRVFNSDSRVKFQAIYIDENTAAQIKQIPGHDYIKAGWWDKNKKDGIGIPTEDAYVGDEPMPAGCGVMGNAATAGAYIEIPTAI